MACHSMEQVIRRGPGINDGTVFPDFTLYRVMDVHLRLFHPGTALIAHVVLTRVRGVVMLHAAC